MNHFGHLFFRRSRPTSGQALVEFILIIPIVFLLIINLVNFGGFFYAWVTVANAARAGADYAALGGASAGAPATATKAQILALITADITSLPNSSSLSVDICQRLGATTTTIMGSCSSIPADPESTYTVKTVDVTYTYKPFITGFTFPKLGVYLTIPPTTIYQRADVRAIN